MDLQNGTVTFGYKDYAHGSQIRSMTLPLVEFVRRFCLHILPARFVKIRSYGLLSNRERSSRIAQVRALLAQGPDLAPAVSQEVLTTLKPAEPPPLVCPYCGQPALILIRVVQRPKNPLRWDTS